MQIDYIIYQSTEKITKNSMKKITIQKIKTIDPNEKTFINYLFILSW